MSTLLDRQNQVKSALSGATNEEAISILKIELHSYAEKLTLKQLGELWTMAKHDRQIREK